jgi:hypothetical protein
MNKTSIRIHPGFGNSSSSFGTISPKYAVLKDCQCSTVEGHMMHRIPTGQESPIRSTFHRDAISRIDRSPVLSVSRPITTSCRHTMSSSDSSLASSFFSSAFSSAGAAPPAAAAGAEPPPPPPDGTEASFWDPSEMSCGSVTTRTTQTPGLVTRD